MSETPSTLYSIVLSMTAEQSGYLPKTHGKLLHGAFYNIIRTIDPDLSEMLHVDDGKPPFTVSPLHGLGKPHNNRFRISSGRKVWLRITLFGDMLLHSFLPYFTKGESTIHVGAIRFNLLEIHTSSKNHKYADICNTAALFAQWQTEQITPQKRKIELAFRTPTAFGIRRLSDESARRPVYLFPDPSLVFSELARYWDNLWGSDSQEIITHFAQDYIFTTKYRLKTALLDFKSFKQVGFVGEVAYQIEVDADESLTRQVNLLADLAFYTGIGSRTGMGMGQVSRR